MDNDARVSPRVLIADDDPVIRHLLASLVRRIGFIPVAVTDGRQAFRLLTTDSDFAGAVIDLQMPKLDGVELIQHMRTEKRLIRIPVMMMSAKQDPNTLRDCFDAGGTMFLPKPFTTEKLQSALRILLNGSAAPKSPRPRKRSAAVLR